MHLLGNIPFSKGSNTGGGPNRLFGIFEPSAAGEPSHDLRRFQINFLPYVTIQNFRPFRWLAQWSFKKIANNTMAMAIKIQVFMWLNTDIY